MKSGLKLKERRTGFTLLELSVAISVGMAVGAMVLALLNQQITFLRIFQAQSFLNEEAPIANNHINRLLINAERFRLHPTLNDAVAGTNATLDPSPVLVLNYRQPNGTMRAGILSFQNNGLYYYVVPTVGPLAAPQWAVTRQAADVTFFVQNGVLRTRFTGPAGEEITFSGAMQ